MAIEYRKEFFDRTYTAREAYGRVWKYARKYKFRSSATCRIWHDYSGGMNVV